MPIDHNTVLQCPNCLEIIKFSIEDLLFKNEIICPSCSLKMEMNVPTEMKKHLREILHSPSDGVDDTSIKEKFKSEDLSRYIRPTKDQ